MKKKKTKRKWFRKLFLIFFIFSLLISGSIFIWISTFRIPDLKSISDRRVTESTKIYDRTGKVLLYDLHKDTKRTIVPFSEISLYAKNAIVTIEDAEFYEHNGVKPIAFLRSALANIKTMSFSQGGSTLTQQVVKNSVLTTEKKITRKLKEWVLAYKLEQVMTKEEILNLYLNEAPYGGNIYGIEEASLAFFGKNAKDLNLVESAYLTAIPQAPTYYSPYGNNRDGLETRKNLVLSQMLKNGFISEKEYLSSSKIELEFIPRSETGILAPHFVMFIKEYLEQKYGEKVSEEGYKVITSLDYDLQEKAEQIANKYALENTEKFNAENAAIVAIDAQTGQILVMVGSRNYFDKDIDGNFNITLAHRQPGSAFKPFVYATAFNKGYTPETVVFDLETEFSTECNSDSTPILKGDEYKCYSPVNYDGIFRGPVSLRDALAQSINVPAIKTLYLAGLNDSLKTAKDLGIKSLIDVNQYGLTLVLGGGEVSLLDITTAYSGFANKGMVNNYTGILKIEKDEKIIESFHATPKEVLPKQTALMITDILSDNVARTPAFGTNSPLYFNGKDVASKTGTTNDYKDAWIIGYTPTIAVGAWAGNNDNTSMEKKVAGFVVAPMWHEFVSKVLQKYPDEKFEKPEKLPLDEMKPIFRGLWLGGKTYVIDKMSKKLATEYTPESLREEVIVQDIHSILYWVDKKNPQGIKPEYPENDFQFDSWEYRVDEWVLKNNFGTTTVENIPTEFDDIHKPEFYPQFVIVNPNNLLTYNKYQKINIKINNVSNHFPISKIDYYINGIFIGSSHNQSTFSFIPNDIRDIKTENNLKVIIYDNVLNKGIQNVYFRIE